MNSPGKPGNILFIMLALALLIGLLVLRKRAGQDDTFKDLPQRALPASENQVAPPFKDVLLHLPDSLRDAGDLEGAFFNYQKSADHYRKSRNWPGYIWALNAVANMGIRTGRYNEAFAALREGLKTGKQKLGPQHRYVGNAYYFLGEYYYNLKKTTEALAAHNRSLSIRKQLYGTKSEMITDNYIQIAQIYQYLLFDYNKAGANLDTARMILEKHPETDPLDLAYLYYDLAAANRLKGDLELALLYANEYLSVAVSLHDPQMLELAYSNLGGIYFSKQDFENSVRNVRLAISLNLNRAPEMRPGNLAFYYNDLGNAFLLRRQFGPAIANFKKALAVYDTYSHADTLVVSNSFASLGNAYMQSKHLDSARIFFEKCLKIRQVHFGKKHYKVAQAYQNLSECYLADGDFKNALKIAQQALIAGIADFNIKDTGINPSVASIAPRFNLYAMVSLKARILKSMYGQTGATSDLRKALTCYQITDTLMENYATSYDSEGSKLALAADTQPIYEQALECIFELSKRDNLAGYHALAMQFMERSKSRQLLREIRKAGELSETGVPDSLINREKNYSQQLASAQRDLELLLTQNNSDKNGRKAVELRSRIWAVTRRYLDFKTRLQIDYPGLKGAGGGTAATMDEVRGKLADGQKVLAYFWGSRSIFLLAMSNAKSRFIRIPRSNGLMETFGGFVRSFSEQSVPGDAALRAGRVKQYQARAWRLYQALVNPALESETDRELVIIPDGPLAYLPFNALITSNSGASDYRSLPYLLKTFHTRSEYSATLMMRPRRLPSLGSPKVLGMAFSDKLSRQKAAGSLASLPGTARELDYISSVMKGNFLKGANATESAFRRLAPGFDILHLAVHGSSDTTRQFESHLIFSPGKSSRDDGLLYAHELFSIQLKARLVVLSACETGLGKMLGGEGVYSMTRGFAVAGCPSLIMSLWKIDDNTTARLMSDFYTRLSAGAPVHEALTGAQNSYISNSDELTADPRFWAAFVPIGDERPLVFTFW